MQGISTSHCFGIGESRRYRHDNSPDGSFFVSVSSCLDPCIAARYMRNMATACAHDRVTLVRSIRSASANSGMASMSKPMAKLSIEARANHASNASHANHENKWRPPPTP